MEGQVSRIVVVVGICTSHISTAFIAFAFEFFGAVCRGVNKMSAWHGLRFVDIWEWEDRNDVAHAEYTGVTRGSVSDQAPQRCGGSESSRH